MKQTGSVILEYHKAESQGASSYWTGKVLGRDMKFVRIIVGLAHPTLDRQAAAAITIGELYRSFAPADYHGLAAAVGSWPEVKNVLMTVCRDLKPDNIVVQDEQSRKLVFPITDALVGKIPFNVLSSVAPAHASTELGRQNVELLINEDRLHLGHLLEVLDLEKDPSDKALRYAVNWALEFTAFYPGKKRGPLQLKRVLGTEGL